MTENEAINGLKNLVSEHELDLPHTDSLEILRMAIQALEEIQQYRAIGTVEECRAAVDKMKPYKPKEYEDRYYACKCGNILLPKWEKYPTKLMPKSEGLPYCMACGQALLWEKCEQHKEFNQSECDWKYHASCAADTNCADECNMICPYIKNQEKIENRQEENTYVPV